MQFRTDLEPAAGQLSTFRAAAANRAADLSFRWDEAWERDNALAVPIRSPGGSRMNCSISAIGGSRSVTAESIVTNSKPVRA